MAMKRFLVALVAFMLLITMLTACDGDGEESKNVIATGSSDVSGNSDLWESGITGLDFEGREFIILSSYTHGNYTFVVHSRHRPVVQYVFRRQR